MLIALLAAAALAWWLHQRGELLPHLQTILLGGGALLLAVRMLETGKPLAALALAGAAYFGWRYSKRRPRVAVADLAAARALLGVDAGADAATIRAAWLARMATDHPDRGGNAEAAAAATAARDMLIAAQLKG